MLQMGGGGVRRCGARRVGTMTFRAIQAHDAGGPEVLQITDLPDLTPGPGEVLVETRAPELAHYFGF